MKPLFGVINFDDRYTQTLETFASIRIKDPTALIVFSDSSVYPLTDDELETITSNVDMVLDFSKHEECIHFNKNGSKSHGENYMLFHTIQHLKTIYDFDTMEGRMFKVGARCTLLDDFNIKDYDNCRHKYVFKTRANSWMSASIQDAYGSTHILQTRLYSWDFSLVEDYLTVIKKNFIKFSMGFDTEHSHLMNIDPDKLIERDMLHCHMIMALNGQIMLD